MKKPYKIIFLIIAIITIILLSIQYISQQNIAVLNPKGMIAIKQRDLIYWSIGLMCIVVIPVFIMTLIFSWKYRKSNTKAKYSPDWGHSTLAEIVWWGVPLAIIVVLAIMTWKSSFELNPFKPIVNDKKPIQIQVVALDWKWLFIYPEQNIATVNYVQFPEKTPLNFEITSDAPMNSFWIPQLGGQIYAMPAMRTKLHLIANETGNFRGSSANISGTGFSGMFFTAVSSTEQDFDAWVASVKETGSTLSLQEYEELVKPSQYHPVTYYSQVENNLFNQIIMKYMYTGSESRIGMWQGGARHLSRTKSQPKQPNLGKLGDAGWLKCRGCPTQPKPILNSRAVYMGIAK